ncbi:DinB family protein [Acinetobacter sp. MD2]|uniref:DinB family protein n=1 Tax=Acinetobacter sp. MD2 TaxID=2600066 RepID=UPI002D1F6DC7|nr:DinB family protein [Acinetobacter sp. MD2]MEB3766713.1 DinB family protein [Acinetobacter sp. MD2]
MDVQSLKYCAEYHLWATKRLALSLEQISDHDFYADCGLFFHSVFGTLNHLVLGERDLWFARFQGKSTPIVALNRIVETDRAALISALNASAAAWYDFIIQLDHHKIPQQLHYITSAGQKISLPYLKTLWHVLNHATHHRGQMTVALTQQGYQCPELDMVYMLLEQQISIGS